MYELKFLNFNFELQSELTQSLILPMILNTVWYDPIHFGLCLNTTQFIKHRTKPVINDNLHLLNTAH